jgi:hypothetical protein
MKTMTRQILRKTVAFTLVAVIPLAGGCSAFQPRTQRVTIVPSEPDAKVYLNNNPVGTGKTTLELERNRTYAVSARSGQGMGSASIGRRVSGTGVLDIVGGCIFLVPFIGCFTPGFWELDKTIVSVPVNPATAATSQDAVGE